MRKNIIMISVTCLLCACNTTQSIRHTQADFSEKKLSLIEDNSNFSTASIVGGGANLAEDELDRIQEKNKHKRMMKINSIDGLTFDSFTENGKEKLKATVQNEILFKFDSYEVNDKAKGMLVELTRILADTPDARLKIVGHTDNIGEKEYNLVLSRNRASAVANIIRNSGFPTDKITEEGRGLSVPIASNKTKEGRAKNRRVDIILSNVN